MGSEYLHTQGWGPGGEDGVRSLATGEWLILFILALPVHLNTETFALSQSKVPAVETCPERSVQSTACTGPALTFGPRSSLVALVPKFQSMEREKMEKREKGPAEAHHGRVSCLTTYGRPQRLSLPSVPGQWKPLNHGGSCALLSTANT